MFFPTLLLPVLMMSYPTMTELPDPVTTSDHELKSVHVVFRHGDSVKATPDFYPSHPDAPHDFNPRVHSDLTNTGRMRAYKLGQYLRSRYSDFLGERYNREDVYARSTYLERARASLLLVLAGLYPPTAEQRWHPTLDWQPISIESPENEASDPLMWSIGCSTYRAERREIENTEEFAKAIQGLVDFFVQLELYKNPNRTFTDAELTDLYRKLRIGVDADVSIPDWRTSTVFKNVSARIVRNAAILRYHTQNYSPRARQLNGGMLLRKIVDDMQAVVDGKAMPKINLYSGHEFNVVGLLWALDAWKPIIPSYATAVIVELWVKDFDHSIRILYHDGISGDTETRMVDECGTKMCPLELLIQLRHMSLPRDVHDCYTEFDHRKQCYKKPEEPERDSNDV